MTTVALAPAALSTRHTWYGSVGAVFAGLFANAVLRLAARRPMAHSLALGGIGFVIGVVGAVATWGTWTSWYSLAIIAVTLPSAWLGARLLRLRQSPALS
jgi:hypothetical protein